MFIWAVLTWTLIALQCDASRIILRQMRIEAMAVMNDYCDPHSRHHPLCDLWMRVELGYPNLMNNDPLDWTYKCLNESHDKADTQVTKVFHTNFTFPVESTTPEYFVLRFTVADDDKGSGGDPFGETMDEDSDVILSLRTDAFPSGYAISEKRLKTAYRAPRDTLHLIKMYFRKKGYHVQDKLSWSWDMSSKHKIKSLSKTDPHIRYDPSLNSMQEESFVEYSVEWSDYEQTFDRKYEDDFDKCHCQCHH